ncbi:MAG: hypothetical protein JWO05_741 [Gemmatimonadetes bacterium]|nr:hypothetical protein [Gemmatimonadota bacterium]
MLRNTTSIIRRALSGRSGLVRTVSALAVAGLFAVACDVHGISAPGSLASISVSPDATVGAGAGQQLVAVGLDAEGHVVPISPTWSVATGGGTINTSGMFTAGSTLGVFNKTGTASVGSISGAATITVVAGPLASITLTPNPATLAISTTQQFTAVGKDAGGNIVNFTPTWAVVAGGGAIAQTGIFTAGTATGSFAGTVQVTSGAIKAVATVNVTGGALATITVTPNPATLAAGTQQQFTAVGMDASGNVVQLNTSWSVAQGGGSIDGAGLFTAGPTPGTFTNTVVATSGGLTGSATVIVTAGFLNSIVVTPNPANLAQGAVQQFTAVGIDGSGNTVPISATWAVVAGGGTINASTGVFTAGAAAGTFTNTVRATANGLSGFATVNVGSGLPLATITVTPNPVTMGTGSQQQFTATGRDGNGNITAITPVWSVVNGGGTINQNGLFTSGNVAGTFTNTIQATSGAISGNATVTVTAVVPIPPAISPLNSAAAFGILAGSGISCAISGSITGATGPSNIGSSPTLTITGFPPCTFSGSIPSPAVVATAKGDLTAAYLAAQGQVCNTVLTGFDLGFYDGSTPAKSLPPGTYCFSSSAALTGTLKLTGSATAKWTFQIGSTLNAEVSSKVILAGGAIPDNVYWAVGSSATIKTGAAFQGNIMSFASITFQNGTSLLGRALAQNGAVDLITGGTTIVKP